MREQAKELVTYILCPKDRDKDVIENYTDTLINFAREYHAEQLKLYTPKCCCCKKTNRLTGETGPP